MMCVHWCILFMTVLVAVVAVRVDDDEVTASRATLAEQPNEEKADDTKAAVKEEKKIAEEPEEKLDPHEMAAAMKKRFHHRVNYAKELAREYKEDKVQAQVQACVKCKGCYHDDMCYTTVPDASLGGEITITRRQCGFIHGTWCANVTLVPTTTPEPDEEETEEESWLRRVGEMSAAEQAEQMKKYFHHRVHLAKGLVAEEQANGVTARVQACVKCTGCLKKSQCYITDPETGNDYTENMCGYIMGTWCKDVVLVTTTPEPEEEPESAAGYYDASKAGSIGGTK